MLRENVSEGFRYRHVLALNPYFGHATTAMGIFPPTGLEYIAASMKDLVDKVTLMDLRYEEACQDPETLNAFIRDEHVDLLCVTIGWTAQFETVCDLVKRLPPEVCTVVGGHKATEEVELLFERCPNIDMVVRGEGEETIRRIVRGDRLETILGLSYREGGKIVHNPNQELPSLDTIAFPDRSLRRQEYRIIQYGVRLSRHTFDTVLTTRGCPFNCTFCTFSLNPLGQKRTYAERSVESVIEELKTITADVVLFSDDNFFTNPKRTERLCDLIIENGIKKTFVVQARIDVAKHPRALEKARQAGFRVFLIGIESPHDRILGQLQKGITQQQIRESVAILRGYDFYLHGYFIYGNLGESREEMLYIAKFAREIKLDSISFQKLRAEKFSPIKQAVEETPGYWYDRVGGSVYSDTFGRKELKDIRNHIRADFYRVPQLMHIYWKARRIGLADGYDLLHALVHLPRLLAGLRTRDKAQKQSRD